MDVAAESSVGVSWPARATNLIRRVAPTVVTIFVFLAILQRVPLDRLADVLGSADYALFLAFMIPNAIVYFCWDTLVLAKAINWFHGPIAYSELLPARAASYVVALFNTNLARGALAAYLARRLQQPFLQLGSTVIFLVLTEYTHLVLWATCGLLLAAPHLSSDLALTVPVIAIAWGVFLLYARVGLRPWDLLGLWRAPAAGEPSGPRAWGVLRTFRIAPLRRYPETIALRAPLFVVSLTAHYFAGRAFDVHIPYFQLLAFLPVIFMIAALPITVAHLGTTQAAWIFFFSAWAPEANLLAFSLAAHATFTASRALLGLVFVPRGYSALTRTHAE